MKERKLLDFLSDLFREDNAWKSGDDLRQEFLGNADDSMKTYGLTEEDRAFVLRLGDPKEDLEQWQSELGSRIAEELAAGSRHGHIGVLWPAPAIPEIEKISPTAAARGEMVEVEVVGKSFEGSLEVRFEPSSGRDADLNIQTWNLNGTPQRVSGTVCFEKAGNYFVRARDSDLEAWQGYNDHFVIVVE